MSIPVICSTNLDAFQQEDWPKELACRPTLGDMVQSASGRELQVVRIAHCIAQVMTEHGHRGPRPALCVELNQRLYKP